MRTKALLAGFLVSFLVACTQQARPLGEETLKVIPTAYVTIVGSKMTDMSRIATRSGPLSSRTPEEIEATRKGMRSGFDTADVAGLIRSSVVKHSSLAAPVVLTMGEAQRDTPVTTHQLRIEYYAGLKVVGGLVPDVYPYLYVVARVLDPDGTAMRFNKWTYCGQVLDFAAVAADQGKRITGELQGAALLIGEAILYDTFASTRGRPAGGMGLRAGCTGLDDLPSLKK